MKEVRSLFLMGLMLIAVSLSASSLNDVEKQILKKAKIEQLVLRQNADVVILEGRAASLKDKLEAEKIAVEELKTAMVNRIALSETLKSDEQINLEVAAKIGRKVTRSYVFNNLSVKTTDGKVVLMGAVRDAYLSDRAEKAAMEVTGVRSVENRIKILPVSISDDRLRIAIYRRLSNEFQFYFNGARPSVGIIVDYGRVTLAGYVHSQVDRVRAASMVRQMHGVLSVDNQLQVEHG